jgi:phenylalanyl-tRNA synthetase beta chain
MAVVMDNVQIADSPLWLQAQLRRIGIRSINNVVDVTNYVMYITGQPIHAYDYDKVAKLSSKGAEIIVRHPNADEQLNLLNGKTIVPRVDAVVIASSKESIGLGGVMGGATTEVDARTTRIIIEVASFDMYNIRKTSMNHGLFTDAVTRFSKGQSVHQNDRVLAFAISQMMQFANATQASSVIDVKNELMPNEKITITPEFVNERLGLSLSIDAMDKLLSNVEFIVTKDKGQLHVTAPFWRTDIEIREDVVEEIGRLHGFDKLPLTLPTKSILPTLSNTMFDLKASIRSSLSRFGANEILSYSFIHGGLMEQVGQKPEKAFSLSNALSPQLQYYRLNLTPSLLEKIHPNAKAGYDEFAIFEIGKGHDLDNSDDGAGVPIEFEKLAFVYSAQLKAVPKNSGEAYFKTSYFLKALLDDLHIDYSIEATNVAEAPFDSKRSAVILEKTTGHHIGLIGEYTLKTIKGLKLSKLTAGFELDLEMLLKHAQKNSNYEVLSKYPKISQDISLKVTNETTYQMIAAVIQEEVKSINQQSQTQTTILPLDIFKNESGDMHIAFRLIFNSLQRTLTTDEVSEYLHQVEAQLKSKLKAVRI